MAEIIPAINVEDFAEVKRRIALVADRARIAHIDVADGTFTQSIVWQNAADLVAYAPPIALEIHFMVASPEKKIDAWFLPAVRRIIFHAEAAADSARLIERCHNAHTEAGVAIRPDTPCDVLYPFLDSADLLQILAVIPGPSGQAFDARMLEKIAVLRARAPKKIIEIDGGIKAGIARSCAFAGADLIVAGSALFGHGIDFNKTVFEFSDDIQRKDS